MDEVNVKGLNGRSSRLDSNHLATTREEAKARVEVVKDSTQTELTRIRLVRALVQTRDPSSKVTNFYFSVTEIKLIVFFSVDN